MLYGYITMKRCGAFMKIEPEKGLFLEELEREYPDFCADFSGNIKIVGKVPVSP